MDRATLFDENLGLRPSWYARDRASVQSPESGDVIALLSPASTAAGRRSNVGAAALPVTTTLASSG